MITILSIIDSLSGGGAEKIAADLTFKFTKRFDHTLITVSAAHGETYPHDGDILKLNFKEEVSRPRKLLRQLQIIRRLRYIKKEIRPAVAISHAAMSNFQNILSGRGEKKIVVLHGEFDYKSAGNSMVDLLFRKVYSQADAIVSVSQFISNDFQRHHQGTVPNKVIYNGVDIQNIQQKAEEFCDVVLPEKYLVYLAQLRPEKNHLKFIETVGNTLKRNNLKLVLIGEGAERNKIENLISQNELQNQIFLVGRLENPFPIIKNAVASIVASETESFSLAAVESLALGVPVITADCGGPREILGLDADYHLAYPAFTDCGIVVPHSVDWNNCTFAEEILLIWNNEKLRNSMSAAAFERAKFFTVEKMQQEYLTLINSII